MEDDLKKKEQGLKKMEDDLKKNEWKTTLKKMEVDLKKNGRRPQKMKKWKTTTSTSKQNQP